MLRQAGRPPWLSSPPTLASCRSPHPHVHPQPSFSPVTLAFLAFTRRGRPLTATPCEDVKYGPGAGTRGGTGGERIKRGGGDRRRGMEVGHGGASRGVGRGAGADVTAGATKGAQVPQKVHRRSHRRRERWRRDGRNSTVPATACMAPLRRFWNESGRGGDCGGGSATAEGPMHTAEGPMREPIRLRKRPEVPPEPVIPSCGIVWHALQVGGAPQRLTQESHPWRS